MAADLEQMKQKYAPVLNAINQNGVRLSHMHIQDGKFFLQGVAGSEAIKNRVWDEVKRVDPSLGDITLDLTVDALAAPPPAAAAAAAAASGGRSSSQRTYTVAAGDSLSKIAKSFYGNANQYMKIFEANKDQLSDPDKIKPGQVLVIPD